MTRRLLYTIVWIKVHVFDAEVWRMRLQHEYHLDFVLMVLSLCAVFVAGMLVGRWM